MKKTDLFVVGGGPAGYIPAIRASQLGKRVILAEAGDLGGTCLNRGCIPTKTLAATAGLLRQAGNCRRFGLTGELRLDYPGVMKRKAMIVSRLRKGIEAHLAHLGVEVLRGRAVLKEPGLVEVEGARYPADSILLSPGSKPFLPGFLNAPGVLTSRDVLDWSALPESLIIIGGGVIGCEFASILSAFGVKVTVAEMLPAILPGVDTDVSAVVAGALSRAGVRVLTGKGAEKVFPDGEKTGIELSDGEKLSADRVLVAIGRSPATSGMGLEDAGVKLDSRGCISVDRHSSTNLPGVYAAGDATGVWWLAHAGSAQGLNAVHHAFGAGERTVDPDCMAGCIFTHPEVATVGPGEDEWRNRGVRIRTGAARYIANGRAVGLNETDGFVKIISRADDDRVIGVQIVGAEASSLVAGAVAAVNAGIRSRDWAGFVHPHPTLSELFMESTEALGIGAIHG